MTGNPQPRSVQSLSVLTEHDPDVAEVTRQPVVSGPVFAPRPNTASAPWSQTGKCDRATLTLLFALSFGLYAIGRVERISPFALAGALGVLFFGVGAAPLQLSRTVSLSARLALAGLLGLSAALLIGFIMVLAPLWDPGLFALLLGAAAGVAHAVALPSALGEAELSLSRWPGRRQLLRAGTRPSLLCTLVGSALWLGSAILTGRIVPGIGGFPVQITPVWYGGVVLVLVASVLARSEKHEGYAALAVGSLVLALTLTPALLYGMPRAESAGKHVELVRLVLSRHHLRAGDGIYFAYSAFFDAVAWLCRLARVSDPIGLATFWPVLMGVIGLAELRLLFGALIEGRYRRWAAITLVVLVNSVGTDYFSPQAVGYVLGLGIFALVVNPRPPVKERAQAAIIVLAACALAVTHELSPYVVGCVLVVLALARCARPRWAGLAVLAPAVLWAVLNRKLVTGFVSLSNLLDFGNFRPPQTAALNGLHRAPIVGESSDALLLAMLLLSGGALIGFARHRRERWAWGYLISAGIGLVLVSLVPYGHEGIFRSAVFGIPWLVLLSTYAVARLSGTVDSAGWMLLCLGLLATFLVAAYGMDGSTVIRRADLQAVRIFERAPPNSYLLQVGFGDLPTGPPGLSGDRQLAFDLVDGQAAHRAATPQASDLVTLLSAYREFARRRFGTHVGQLYAIWSPVEALYGYEYGLQTPDAADRWRDLMLASPAWRVVYHQHGTYLFRALEP